MRQHKRFPALSLRGLLPRDFFLVPAVCVPSTTRTRRSRRTDPVSKAPNKTPHRSRHCVITRPPEPHSSRARGQARPDEPSPGWPCNGGRRATPVLNPRRVHRDRPGRSRGGPASDDGAISLRVSAIALRRGRARTIGGCVRATSPAPVRGGGESAWGWMNHPQSRVACEAPSPRWRYRASKRWRRGCRRRRTPCERRAARMG